MWPVLGGIASGIGSLLGGMFTADTSAKNTQMQIAASQQQQQVQNDFQERMSGTAYQRARTDMEAAGLNPMMMSSGGMSASTPSGSSIQAPMPQNTSPFAGLGTAVSKAVDTAVTAKTYDKLTDEIANLKAENAKIVADVDLSRAHGTESTARTRVLDVERQKKNLELPGAEVLARSARDIQEMPEEIRKGINQGRYQDHHVGGLVGGAVGSAHAVYNRARDALSGSSFSDRFNSIYGNSN